MLVSVMGAITRRISAVRWLWFFPYIIETLQFSMGWDSGSALHLAADFPHIPEGWRQERYQLLFMALHGANATQKRTCPYCCKAGELVWAI